ncbi:MAG TPA: hypothetical protein VHE09_11870 [Rhizomicrobium sp.]|jgi:hypothetical protein|nr:hypothetical protein [Rhizomicrobium sp.]
MGPRTQQIDLKLKELLQMLSRSQVAFTRGVVPLFRDDQQRRPELWGTALVIQRAGSVFLVSAKHVLREPQLYMHSRPEEKRFLSGALRTTGDDSLDIGVLKLDGPKQPPYPELNCFPLPFEALVSINTPREGNFYLGLGYPSTRTKPNTESKILVARAYANFAPGISLGRQMKLGYDPHYFIGIALRKSRVFGANGLIQTFPDPHGMSGSPLFHLYDSSKKTNYLGGVRIAGILIEYVKEHSVMIATHIGVARNIILDFANDKT